MPSQRQSYVMLLLSVLFPGAANPLTATYGCWVCCFVCVPTYSTEKPHSWRISVTILNTTRFPITSSHGSSLQLAESSCMETP